MIFKKIKNKSLIFLEKRLNLLIFLVCFIFFKMDYFLYPIIVEVANENEFQKLYKTADTIIIDGFPIINDINLEYFNSQPTVAGSNNVWYTSSAIGLGERADLHMGPDSKIILSLNKNINKKIASIFFKGLKITGEGGIEIIGSGKHTSEFVESTIGFWPVGFLKLEYHGDTILKNRSLLHPFTSDSLSPNSSMILDSQHAVLRIDGNNMTQTIKSLSGNGIVELKNGSSLTVDGSTTSNFSGYFKQPPKTDTSEVKLIKKGSSTFYLLDNTYHNNSKNLLIQIEDGNFLIDSEKLVNENPIEIIGGYFGNVKDKIVTIPLNKPFILRDGGFNVQNETLTINSIIKGAGVGNEQLVKKGGGTLVLNHANNSYSGGTKIDEGTVSFNNSSQLGSGAVILNGGELKNSEQISNFSKSIILNDVATNTINNNAFMIVTSAITGSGGFIKKGSYDLVLSGVNTFSKSIEIQEGSVDVYSDSNLGAASSVIINGGSLVNFTIGATYSKNITLRSNTDTIFSDHLVTFDGVFSGPGSLIKDGSAIVALNNSNSYLGNTTINKGTLQLRKSDALPTTTNVHISSNATLDLNSFNQTLGGISGSGSIDIVGAVLTLSPTSTSDVFSGNIFGNGSVVKDNSGSNTLSGNNNYTGTTTINNGKFIVNGAITSDTTVNASGILKGSGTITGSTIVNGTVSPGNSIGTLNFVGPYTQADGSTLEIEIDHTSSDLVNVYSGSITIGDATLNIISDVDRHSIKTEYIIMQSDTSVSGTFSTVNHSKPHLFSGLIYNPKNVVLIMVAADFEDAKKYNPKRVSNYLLSNNPTNNFDLIQLYIALDDLQKDALNNALNQIHPSKYKGVILSNQNNNKSLFKTILNNLNEPYKQFCKSHNMFWSDFSYDKYDQRGKNYLVGFDSKTKSFIVGNDFYLKYLTIGPFFSFSNSSLKWEKNSADAKLDSIYFGVYNNFRKNRYYLNSIFLTSINFVKANRNIKYDFINKRAYTKHNIYDVAIDIENGFHIDKNKVILRPFINTIYQYLYEDKFLEKKAPGANLTVKSSQNHFLRFEIGSNFSTYFITNKKTYIFPDLGVFYVYEKRIASSSYLSKIDDTFPYFTTYGIKPYPSRIAYNIGISNKLLNSKLNLTLKYQAEYGKKYKDQNINLVIKYDF
jgi:autotransporter-associated beta strand protein